MNLPINMWLRHKRRCLFAPSLLGLAKRTVASERKNCTNRRLGN